MRRSSLSLRSNNTLLAVTAAYAVFFATFLCGRTNTAPADFGALIRLLDQAGYGYDRAALESGAIESAVQAVDRRARLRDKDDFGIQAEKSLDSTAEYYGHIGCLLINGFHANDASNIVDAVKSSIAGQSALIIDLRAADGDDYSTACQAAELLHSATGKLYSVEDLKGNIVTSYIRKAESHVIKPANIPVVVMVDNSTADASEFFAALLKGKSGVLLTGAATRGDPCMRRWLDLDATRKIYLAVSKIKVLGCEFERTGVEPDIAVKEEVGINLESKEPERGLVRRYTSDAARKQKEDELTLTSDRTLRRAVDLAHAITSLATQVGIQGCHTNEDNKAE